MSGVAATKAVTERLRTIVPNAKVWDTLDSTTDPKAFAERFTRDKVIHCYEVTREGSTPVETESVQQIKRREGVTIYGYYSFQQNVSEAIFQAEIDAICAAFDPPRLRRFPEEYGIEWSLAPTVEGPRIGRLSQYIVHFARIIIPVEFDPIC